MTKQIVLVFFVITLFVSNLAHAGDIYALRKNAHGVGQFGEVLKDALYRGGQIQSGEAAAQSPLTDSQLTKLCDQNFGEAVYLYNTGFRGPVSKTCSQGSINYSSISWAGNTHAIMEKIYQSITATHKPVFIHCWWGIHATGSVAATALMQFCHATPDQAVEYWKVGIAPVLQYPKVMDQIRAYRSDPSLELSATDRARVCPQMR